MHKPKSYAPNIFGTAPFIWGWENAFLGNCLSSLANVVVFSLRTGIPAIYPNIDRHRDVFFDPHRSRAVYDPYEFLRIGKDGLHSRDDVARFGQFIDNLFTDYYPGYMRDVSTTDYSELHTFASGGGRTLFLPYRHELCIRDWSENDMESHVANFCMQGNGIILPGAYWNQYTDMRIAAAYGDALRAHLGKLRGDQCIERVAHMRSYPDALKIAIHIRQSDSKNWHGGLYYYEIDQYIAIMRHLHQSLGGRPHIFYVFSEINWQDFDFEGLPVFYQRAEFLDDFVTMGRCHYLVGPPSTFATWSAFLGGAKRIIITKSRIADLHRTSSLLDFAVGIPFPTGSYLPGDPQARPI